MSETSHTFPATSPAALAVFGALGAAPSTSSEETSPTEGLVTVEQAATMQFEPWEPIPDGWRPPSDEEWMPFGEWALPNVRTAWAVMFKTKGELEVVCQELDGALFGKMCDGIGEARKAFKDFLEVLESAEGRLLCAAASAALKDDDREGRADV